MEVDSKTMNDIIGQMSDRNRLLSNLEKLKVGTTPFDFDILAGYPRGESVSGVVSIAYEGWRESPPRAGEKRLKVFENEMRALTDINVDEFTRIRARKILGEDFDQPKKPRAVDDGNPWRIYDEFGDFPANAEVVKTLLSHPYMRMLVRGATGFNVNLVDCFKKGGIFLMYKRDCKTLYLCDDEYHEGIDAVYWKIESGETAENVDHEILEAWLDSQCQAHSTVISLDKYR